MPLEFYVIGYWINPYGRNEREYFWSGSYDTRKEAQFVGITKQRRGQPKNFTNWGKGINHVYSSYEKFMIEAKKVGLNPTVTCRSSEELDLV